MPSHNFRQTRRRFLAFGVLAFCTGKLSAFGASSVGKRVVGSSLVVVYSQTPSWIEEVRNAVVRELGPPCDGPAWVTLNKYDELRIQGLIGAGVRLIEISQGAGTIDGDSNVWIYHRSRFSILDEITLIKNC